MRLWWMGVRVRGVGRGLSKRLHFGIGIGIGVLYV